VLDGLRVNPGQANAAQANVTYRYRPKRSATRFGLRADPSFARN